MPLDSEFLLKVKDFVTSKLKSLGAFIDDELPDYIMVMVANNKSESSMTRDLQLFLGEHTEGFTKWLHSMLQSMKHNDQASKSKDKEAKESTKTRYDRRTSSKGRESPSRSLRSDNNNHQRSRSRSPLRPSKHDSTALLSREPHAQSDSSVMHHDDYEFANEDITSTVAVQEERKIVSTASLRKSKSTEKRKSSEEKEKLNIRSVINVRSASPPKQRPKVSRTAAKHINPSSLLLKKAFNEVRANAEPPESSIPGQSGRKSTYPPIACPDVSSSSSSTDRTKFYVTLSGNESIASSVGFHADSSMESDGFRHGGTVGSSSTNTTPSSVKSRLGSRRVLPYVRPPTTAKLSAKERLGPVVYSHAVPTSVLCSPIDPESTYEDLDEEQADAVELMECETDGDPSNETRELGDYVDTEDQRTVIHAQSDSVGAQKSRLIDRLNQSQLVVNLNETDEDDDVLSPIKGVSKKKAPPETATDGTEPDRTHIPSSLDRCRFWPNCRNGTECPYIHPSEPCPTFPRCRLGATCTYIHPPCRFDAACTRPDCAFTHTVKRVLQKPVASLVSPVSISQVLCRFQSRCTNPACPYYHPPTVIQPVPVVVQASSRPAVAAGASAPSVPLTSSPVPCRYGSGCTNRPKCPFLHRDMPRPEQLKWIAPSKRENAADPETPSAVAESRPASLQTEAVK